VIEAVVFDRPVDVEPDGVPHRLPDLPRLLDDS
jgi:hypothetical protein